METNSTLIAKGIIAKYGCYALLRIQNAFQTMITEDNAFTHFKILFKGFYNSNLVNNPIEIGSMK